MLHADADVLDPVAGVYHQAVFFGKFRNAFFGCLKIKHSKGSFAFYAENDILGYGIVVDQLEMLVHHSYAECRGRIGILDLNFFSADFYDSRIGVVGSEKNRHERRFARSVLSEKSVNFVVSYRQVDIVIGDYAWKSFCDTKHLDRVVFHQNLRIRGFGI